MIFLHTVIIPLIVLAAVVMVIMGGISFWRTNKVRATIRLMRDKGKYLCLGMNAKGMIQMKRMCLASMDARGIIIDARLLKTAMIFKPAKFTTFTQIIGKNAHKIKPHTLGLDPLSEAALESLLQDFKTKAAGSAAREAARKEAAKEAEREAARWEAEEAAREAALEAGELRKRVSHRPKFTTKMK